ncbi:Ig-like domain-containing protein [Streptomyces sp. NPDC001288]|uniref:L,D-transpeptidase n=1 Tax=Streptomyces sp. NPDC001297 TaxID=3364559 RepID=UPI0036CBBCCA
MHCICVRARARVRAAAVLLLVTLTGCSSGVAPTSPGTKGGAGGTVKVSVTPRGRQAVAGQQVRVTAKGGSLTSVTVTDAGGHRLTGRVSDGGARWVSERKAAPGTLYRVDAATRAKDGTRRTVRSSFTTVKADRINKVDWRPGTGGTVGVAQPISLVFDRPVTNRADVEKQLEVTTSNGTEGSWGWLRDWSGRDRVDWRPRTYWKPGTQVTLNAELNGTDSGAGGWFVRDYTTTFTIGRAQVVKVDLDSHRMTVRDGRTVRRIAVSGGTPGKDTRSWHGTAVLLAKEGTVRMNSETVGLGHTYDQMVHSSMRLTWSGMYAHAAPWNAAYFGRANRSHGCIGMSDADAAWLYRQAMPGDPFEIEGKDTKGVVEPGNGFGEWNLSFAAWQSRSALR